jgi:glycerophosphoryl diester phosphodiesterase
MGRRRSTATAESTDADEGVEVIAHRGFADVNPENTLGAFEQAVSVADGPATVELDVMPCASGEPVVFHDATLDRLTDPPAALAGQAVHETPLAALRDLDVLDSGERVPLLREVFETLPAETRLNVELKHPGDDPGVTGLLDPEALARERTRWRPFVERVLSLAGEYDHGLLVSSFYEGALAATRAVDRTVPLAALFHRSIEDGLTVADRHDCAAVHPPLDMIYGTPLFDERHVSGPSDAVDVVARAHDAGRAVNVWTVRTAEQARHLRAAGVDGLIVDDPAVVGAP